MTSRAPTVDTLPKTGNLTDQQKLAAECLLQEIESRETEISERLKLRADLTKETFFSFVPYVGGIMGLIGYAGPRIGFATLLGPITYVALWAMAHAHSGKIDAAQQTILRAQAKLKEFAPSFADYLTHEEDNMAGGGKKAGGMRYTTSLMWKMGMVIHLLISIAFIANALS